MLYQIGDTDRYEKDVGSVATFLLENCKLPLAIIQPTELLLDGESETGESVATSEE